MDWEREVKITKLDEAKNLVFGWLSIAKDADGHDVVDKQGDIIPEDELESAAYDFVLVSRAADEMHDEQQVGKLVESMVFTAEKRQALGIPEGITPTGWWVGFKVQPETFAKVKSGELASFSIGGSAVREEAA